MHTEEPVSCIFFNHEGFTYAIETVRITEILELPELKSFANFPPYFAGVMDFRGGVIPIVDAKVCLGYSPENFTINDVLLVLKQESKLFGMIIPPIHDIQSIEELKDVPFSQYISDPLTTLPIISRTAKFNEEMIFIIDTHSVWKELEELFKRTAETSSQISQPRIPFESRINPKDHELFQERTKRFSEEFGKSFENHDIISLTVLKCNNQHFAIESEMIRELCDLAEHAMIPGKKTNILGFMNLRGDIIPLTDIMYLLQKQALINRDKSKVLILEYKEGTIGLIVDDILTVTGVNRSQFSDMPVSAEGMVDPFITGAVKVENEVIGLLDMNKIIQTIFK